MRKFVTALARDNARRRAKHLAKMKTEAATLARNDPCWPARRRALEIELLRAKPHLAEQAPCGYADDKTVVPRRRVVCPNGVVLHTSWYKTPTCDADLRKARAEANWLIEQDRLQRKGLPNAYPFPPSTECISTSQTRD